MTASAYAFATTTTVIFDPNLQPPFFSVGYQAVVSDGSTYEDCPGCFTYDISQPVSTNICAYKASVAALAATFGFNVPVANILVVMGVN